MQTGNAAGRKTGLAEGLLEQQLSTLSEFVKRSLAAVQTSDPHNVDEAIRREGEIGNAVRIAKTSAQLAMALSKLRGEFTHRMVFRKEEPLPVEQLPPPDAAPQPPSYDGEPPLFTGEEWKSGTLTNEELWRRNEVRMNERARRAGWI
ncbi:MAG: hypothetical protein JSR55_15400 [Proteobacteria bacterium]|nr:hypothetical protein [Pseudomonadota bacterium]